MAWAKGAWAGPQSGIKSLVEGLNGRCGMVPTQFVASGVGRMDDATPGEWLMQRIRNRVGQNGAAKTAIGPADGFPARIGLRNDYCAKHVGYQ